jgi:hypothetical protein
MATSNKKSFKPVIFQAPYKAMSLLKNMEILMTVNCQTQIKVVMVISAVRMMMCCYLTTEVILMALSVCVNDDIFLWEHMDNYRRQRATFTTISGPQFH